MMILVLAGGLGTRLQSVLATVPKALAPVGNVPFLQLQIEHWKSQGVNSFVFLLHHQADLIISFLQKQASGFLKDCTVQWVVEPVPMDTGGAVAFAVKQLGLVGDFLVTNADTWVGAGCQEVFQSHTPAMGVVELAETIRYGQVQMSENNFVISFREKDSCRGAGWINAGLCHLSAELFINWNLQPFSLERISFPAWAACGNLKAVALKTDFIDIGVPDDYFRFCRWIESGKKVKL